MRFRTIIAALLLLSVFSAFSAEKAVIKSFDGRVEIRENAGWTAVNNGMEIKPGTVISTGFNSTAVIDLGSSEIFVKQLTRMSLDELSKSGNTVKTDLNLRLGRIKADVKTSEGLKHNFTLKTPVSTAAVRGTVFTAGMRSLDVEKGKISYSNKIGQRVTVTGGNSSNVGLTGYSAPAEMAEALEAAFAVATTTQAGEVENIITTIVEDYLADQTTLTIVATYPPQP